MDSGEPLEPRTSWLRANGLLVALVVVLLGILPGAGYLQWRWPKVRAEIAERLASAPSEPAERLDFWLSWGEPQLQSRLTQLRFSGEHPWLVTHAVRRADGELDIFGIDLTSPSPARFVREGLRVELHFAAPALLGHGVLRGDNADRVPVYDPGAVVRDPSRRAEELLDWFLGDVMAALPGDIPGAELSVVVARQ